MKRFELLLVIALGTSTFGGFIGYYIAKRSQPPPGREYYLLHEGLDRQAQVYMRFLRAQDSAQPEQMTELRRQALATLRVYVQEVADMQARGFSGRPSMRSFTPLHASTSRHIQRRTDMAQRPKPYAAANPDGDR